MIPDPQSEGQPEGAAAATQQSEEFEAAMREGRTHEAVALAPMQADPATATVRAWNLTAYGVDRAVPLSVEESKAIAEQSAERAVAHIVAEHGGQRTCDNARAVLWDRAVAGGPVHDRDAPWIVYRLISHFALTDAEVRRLARWAWTHCEFPEANFDTDGWRFVFKMIGEPVFDEALDADEDPLGHDPEDDDDEDESVEDERARLIPTGPVRLYRGAVPERAVGMAWSGSRETAQWFARRWSGMGRGNGEVYTTVVAPDRIFARFTGRGEDEYVIDTEGLRLGRDVVLATGAEETP
ncbi:hypothetical protein [Nocardioides sp. Leaf285]|uniref:hypothetical protein n=1 Tax=Nocardioides sp. Leaf285 TaxID=1736322 RepID=UPI000702DFD5|nr:hypothetical protein [Nocardioides sp. Leaf285]KQP62919.1 hypothetical protein ASF47_18070 [Nocardioides sp. Leaf285]